MEINSTFFVGEDEIVKKITIFAAMDRFLRRHNSNIIASLMLVIISLYYINSTMFSHTHVIEGATIVHSHFYGADHTSDGEPSEDAPHSESELTLIQHLNNITLLKSEFIFSLEILSEEGDSLYVPSSIKIASHRAIGLSSPRAPPVAA